MPYDFLKVIYIKNCNLQFRTSADYKVVYEFHKQNQWINGVRTHQQPKNISFSLPAIS